MIKPLYRIFTAAFLLDGAILLGFTAMPFFVFNQLGGTERMSGTIAAVQAICYAAACIVSAQFVMRVRNGLMLGVAGVAAYTVLFSVSGLVRSPVLFTVLTLTGLSSMCLVWPAMQSWLGGEPDTKVRSRNIAIFNLCWSSGMVAGAMVAGPSYDLNFGVPFLLVAVCGVTAIVLLVSVPREQDYYAGRVSQTPDGPVQAVRDLESETHLYTAWFANMMGWALMNAVAFVYPKHVQTLVESGELRWFAEQAPPLILTVDAATKFSWIAAAMLAGRTLMFVVMGWSQVWRHRFGFLAGGQAAAAAALWWLGATQSLAAMIVCALIIGMNGGAAFFASLSYCLANARLKHRRAALNEATVGLGNFLGPIIAGALAGWYGVTWPFRYAPFLIAVAMGAQWLLLRHGRRLAERAL